MGRLEHVAARQDCDWSALDWREGNKDSRGRREENGKKETLTGEQRDMTFDSALSISIYILLISNGLSCHFDCARARVIELELELQQHASRPPSY